MFREALLLLRRSRGERATSLQVRLFAFFALFAAALVGTGFLALMLAGVFNTAEPRHNAWLDAENNHLQDGISGDYSRLALRGVAYATTLSSNIQAWAREYGGADGTSAKRIESLLMEQAGGLINLLENNACSGAFIILDEATNPSAKNAAYSRAGLCFTRREPNSLISVSPKVYCLRGPASVARANGAELLGQWKMDFDVGGMPFYNKVLTAARVSSGADLSRLYYWSERFLLDGDSEYSMVLCVPLISRDGTVYGVFGMAVGDMLFKRQYSPDNTEYPHIFASIAPLDGDGFHTGFGLIAGNSYLTSQTIGTLKLGSGQGNAPVWRDEAGAGYVGRTQTLRLYPAGSPFADEAWQFALLMPDSDWSAAVKQSNHVFYGFLVALLAVSFFAAVFISRRYIRPVVAALESIRSDNRAGVQKTQIAEIDDLLDYLSALDGERKALGDENISLAEELEQARLRAEVIGAETPDGKKSPILTAYEQFRKNLDSLTTTEQAVFNLYMKDFTAHQIAEELFITINTVKFHNRNIYSKLGVSSLKELMVYVKMMKRTPDGE